RLGRDLQPVSIDLHRHVRYQVRDDECRPPLYGQGNCRAARAVLELPAADDWLLGVRVPNSRRRQYLGFRACTHGTQALACAFDCALLCDDGGSRQSAGVKLSWRPDRLTGRCRLLTSLAAVTRVVERASHIAFEYRPGPKPRRLAEWAFQWPFRILGF